MIPWEENKGDVFRIAAEEIATGGTHGYLVRTVPRLREELGMEAVTKDALEAYLRRSKEWSRIREEAREAEVGGTVEVEITVQEPPPPPEPLPPDHPMVRELEQEVAGLREERRILRRKLRKADQQAAVTRAVVEVLREELTPWEPKPMIGERPVPSGEHKVDGVLLLSDEHADREVKPDVTLGIERYGYPVYRARAQRMVEVLEGFAGPEGHLPNYQFERLWIFSLGDKINGKIHGMEHRNSFGNSLRATQAVIDVEAEMMMRLSRVFPEVHFIGVSGNHPRSKKKHDPEDPHDNLDYAIGCGIARRLEGLIEQGRATVHLPRAWMAFANVRGWQCALSHGDEVRSYRGFPWYGFDRREGRVKALTERASQINEGVPPSLDYLMYGHFHTPTKRSHANSRSIHNGAWYETDAYTVKQLSVGTLPEQSFLVFRDKRQHQGHVFEIPIYLRDPERESRLAVGEWEPEIGRSTILDAVA